MPYQAAIFDLDGTLIDSVRDIAESMNRSLAAMGYPTHAVEQYNYFIGEGIQVLVERALPEGARDEASVKIFMDGYRTDYLNNWNVYTTIYPGIPEFLRRMVAAHIPMGVLSNKPDLATRKCVEHFFPDIPFIFVAGQRGMAGSAIVRRLRAGGAHRAAAVGGDRLVRCRTLVLRWTGADHGAHRRQHRLGELWPGVQCRHAGLRCGSDGLAPDRWAHRRHGRLVHVGVRAVGRRVAHRCRRGQPPPVTRRLTTTVQDASLNRSKRSARSSRSGR